MVNSQALLYELNTGEFPGSIDALIDGSGTYLNENQRTCPNGKGIYLSDGQAYAS